MANEKILIVEDETSISRLVTMYLQHDGYRVVVATDGIDGLRAFDDERPDLVVLDLLLPRLDGMEVCRRIRQRSQTPILMLTAMRGEADKIAGLELGADDYLTKPFSPREMVTRVKAILRRTTISASAHPEPEVITAADMTINIPRRQVMIQGDPVDLTNKEFELLRTLAKSPGTVFTRDDLLNHVWGHDYYGDARTVDVHIGTLRKKIEPNVSVPRYIRTVWGVGYKFAGDERA